MDQDTLESLQLAATRIDKEQGKTESGLTVLAMYLTLPEPKQPITKFLRMMADLYVKEYGEDKNDLAAMMIRIAATCDEFQNVHSEPTK